MSGGLSIPIGAWALLSGATPAKAFVIIAFIGLMSTAVSLAIRLAVSERRFHAKLRISCSPDIPNCNSRSRWGDLREKKWYSCMVEVTSEQAVEDTRATLEQIEKDGKILWSGPSHQLPFSPCGSVDSFSKTVRPKRREYFSVIVVDTEWGYVTDEWPIEKQPDRIAIGAPTGWPHLPILKDIFSESGVYRLQILVSGKDAPTEEVTLEFFSAANTRETSCLRLVTPCPRLQCRCKREADRFSIRRGVVRDELVKRGAVGVLNYLQANFSAALNSSDGNRFVELVSTPHSARKAISLRCRS